MRSRMLGGETPKEAPSHVSVSVLLVVISRPAGEPSLVARCRVAVRVPLLDGMQRTLRRWDSWLGETVTIIPLGGSTSKSLAWSPVTSCTCTARTPVPPLAMGTSTAGLGTWTALLPTDRLAGKAGDRLDPPNASSRREDSTLLPPLWMSKVAPYWPAVTASTSTVTLTVAPAATVAVAGYDTALVKLAVIWRALLTLSLFSVTVRNVSFSERGVPLCSRTSFCWAHVRSGLTASMSATAPVTCGTAIDVPLAVYSDSLKRLAGTVETMLAPGAARWMVSLP
mmetsp:Transcript_10949/g.31747  ORF Transcript_10949/g.31747 Transcript_10949/m.31747 type:complete len:282 (-) Transcript_10949:2455-3300(-)